MPGNFVTRHARVRITGKFGGMGGEVHPQVPTDLVEGLERAFPPACYNPTDETIEDHLQYAGAVALVKSLRDIHDRQQRELRTVNIGDIDDEDGVDVDLPEHSD